MVVSLVSTAKAPYVCYLKIPKILKIPEMAELQGTRSTKNTKNVDPTRSTKSIKLTDLADHSIAKSIKKFSTQQILDPSHVTYRIISYVSNCKICHVY